MNKFFILLVVVFATGMDTIAQSDRWQQRVKYTMNIDMDVNTNRFKGTQKLVYTNNSPDVLNKLFYHLYFNAFQPNSSMDVRSQELGKTLVNHYVSIIEKHIRPITIQKEGNLIKT